MALFANQALYERVESKQEIIVFVRATYQLSQYIFVSLAFVLEAFFSNDVLFFIYRKLKYFSAQLFSNNTEIALFCCYFSITA